MFKALHININHLNLFPCKAETRLSITVIPLRERRHELTPYPKALFKNHKTGSITFQINVIKVFWKKNKIWLSPFYPAKSTTMLPWAVAADWKNNLEHVTKAKEFCQSTFCNTLVIKYAISLKTGMMWNEKHATQYKTQIEAKTKNSVDRVNVSSHILQKKKKKSSNISQCLNDAS